MRMLHCSADIQLRSVNVGAGTVRALGSPTVCEVPCNFTVRHSTDALNYMEVILKMDFRP